MTEAPRVEVRAAVPAMLLILEIWGNVSAVERRLSLSLPTPGKAMEVERRRMLWWEPRTWLIRTQATDRQAEIDELGVAAGSDGAVTDVSGGFVRHQLEGYGWRELLMIGAVFDAESPAFAPGSVAGTVIHHMPVRLDVLRETAVEVYVPPSYSNDLHHHWRQAIARLTNA